MQEENGSKREVKIILPKNRVRKKKKISWLVIKEIFPFELTFQALAGCWVASTFSFQWHILRSLHSNDIILNNTKHMIYIYSLI